MGQLEGVGEAAGDADGLARDRPEFDGDVDGGTRRGLCKVVKARCVLTMTQTHLLGGPYVVRHSAQVQIILSTLWQHVFLK